MLKSILLFANIALIACTSSSRKADPAEEAKRAAASVTDPSRSSVAMGTDECWGRLMQIQMKRLAKSHEDGTYGTDAVNMRFDPSSDVSLRYCEQYGFFKDKKPSTTEQAVLNEFFASSNGKTKGT